jgi:hypothetical protein
MGIVLERPDFLSVSVRGRLYRLAGLPMGLSLSPNHFCAFTDTFVRHLRQPEPCGFTTHHGRPTHHDSNMPSKRYLWHTRWKGAKILPCVDDFLLFAATQELTLALRQRVDILLTSLKLLRHPTKGFWEPTYALASTKRHVTSSHQHKKFSSSPSTPGNYCNVLREQADGYLSRSSCHSRTKLNKCFSLSLVPYFSSASCTPYLATSGEDESASPLSSGATYNGGHRHQVKHTERTSTAQSRQPTYIATVRAMVKERY